MFKPRVVQWGRIAQLLGKSSKARDRCTAWEILLIAILITITITYNTFSLDIINIRTVLISHLNSLSAIIMFFYFVFFSFYYTLTGYGPITYMISGRSRISLWNPDATQTEKSGTSNIVKTPEQSDPSSNADSPVSATIINDKHLGIYYEISTDSEYWKTELLFSNSVKRSRDEKDRIQRRPQTLMLMGTMISFFGLFIFVLTLSEYFLPGQVKPTAIDWSVLIPRAVLLLFVQVLAGFFLRQYRAAIEDFRYYEEVLRYRESQYISFRLRSDLQDKKLLKDTCEDILENRQFGLMSSDAKIVAETLKAERNEMSNLVEETVSLIKGAIPGNKPAAAPKPKPGK